MTQSIVFVESSYTGAGELCIQAAIDFGMRPILLCRDSRPYAFASKYRTLLTVEFDTTDASSVVAFCRQQPGLTAIASTDDYSMTVVATAAAALRLTGPDPRAVARCKRKSEARLAMNADSDLRVRSGVARSVLQARAIAEDLGFPLVAKPDELTGSIAVARCNSTDDVVKSWDTIQNAWAPGAPSGARAMLLEEYLDGPEFSVECFDGHALAVTKKYSAEGNFTETGVDFPPGILEDVEIALRRATERALSLVGLNVGPAHVEARIIPSGPRVIEINPRLAGLNIPKIVLLGTGIDLARSYIASLCGRPTDLVPSRRDIVVLRCLTLKQDCNILEISPPSNETLGPGVVFVTTSARTGRFEPSASNLDIVAQVIARGDTHEEAERSALNALSSIRMLLG